jgi:pimeloyl-ACP methyl ester carboxylesterase
MSSLALLLLIAGAGCARVAPPVQYQVKVGGHRLSMLCAGEGRPVVVMDSGLGESMTTWAWVWPEVSEFTRVCVYDRAGLGRSQAGPLPRTSGRIVDELRLLLDRSEGKGPFVLVGHSFGGLNVRLFASQHPERVAGLVLVEATHADYPLLVQETLGQAQSIKLETNLAAISPSALSELRSIQESAEQLQRGGAIPEVPLTVISGARRPGTDESRELWERLQMDLTRANSRGIRVIAEQSGHYVQFDQPELVVGVIRQVVTQARSDLGILE